MKRSENQSDIRPIGLKQLAQHLGLSPATVSLVVNGAPAASSIVLTTWERILAAAKKLDYKPNFLARSLRTRQSFTIGVVVPEFSEGYFTMVMNGIEEHLLQSGYLHFVVSHLHRTGEIAAQLLLKRIQNAGEAYPDTIMFEPELIVRESTAALGKPVKASKKSASTSASKSR